MTGRSAGFSSDQRLCGPTKYCLVLDSAYGGNAAFAIMSLMYSYSAFRDPTYLEAAEEIGRWMVGNLTDYQGPAFNPDPATQSFGGYFLGYADQGVPKDRVEDLLRSKSIENNADIFAAFTMIAFAHAAVGETQEAELWQDRANVAGDFVMEIYDPGDPQNLRDGHFFAGTLPVGIDGPPRGPGLEPDGPQRGEEIVNVASFLDSNTFTALALASSSRYHRWIDRNGDPIDWREPLRYVVDTFDRQITARSNGEQVTYEGFNLTVEPTSSQFRPGMPEGGLPDGIAWEFTAQTIVAMQFLDEVYESSEFRDEASRYFGQIESAQLAAPFGDGKGLVASTLDGEDDGGAGYPPLDQCLGTPFQCIPERVGLAATVWWIDAAGSSNIFVLPPWHNPVDPLDVTADRHVVPGDVLTIINRLNAEGPGRLPIPPQQPSPPPYYDVNNDGFVAPLDALVVINYLNRRSGGEGEAAATEVHGRDHAQANNLPLRPSAHAVLVSLLAASPPVAASRPTVAGPGEIRLQVEGREFADTFWPKSQETPTQANVLRTASQTRRADELNTPLEIEDILAVLSEDLADTWGQVPTALV